MLETIVFPDNRLTSSTTTRKFTAKTQTLTLGQSRMTSFCSY